MCISIGAAREAATVPEHEYSTFGFQPLVVRFTRLFGPGKFENARVLWQRTFESRTILKRRNADTIVCSQTLFWKRCCSIFRIWDALGASFGRLGSHFGAVWGVLRLHFGRFGVPMCLVMPSWAPEGGQKRFWKRKAGSLDPPCAPKMEPKII